MDGIEAPELIAQQKPAVEWMGLYNLAVAFLAEETGEADETWKARLQAVITGMEKSEPVALRDSG